MSEVHPNLIQLFNRGAAHARTGEYEAAVTDFLQAIRLVEDPRGPQATAEFLVTCQMRLAWCLMDLERYREALDWLEAAKTQSSALRPEFRYELYFSLGNTLGQLGRLDEAFSHLVNAISAAEDLDDYTERPDLCWRAILAHGRRAQDWRFVQEKAAIAKNTAALRGMDELYVLAQVAAKEAHDEARLASREQV